MTAYGRILGVVMGRGKVVRTQVQLTEEQACGLRALAVQRGVSLAELVREGVEHVLEESKRDELWQRSFQIIGRYTDTANDVSQNHDYYLEEAYSYTSH